MINKIFISNLVILLALLFFSNCYAQFHQNYFSDSPKQKLNFNYLKNNIDTTEIIYQRIGNNFSLFNQNVNFSTRKHTYRTSLKMGAEVLSGSLLGYALGSYLYRTFEPKVKDENFIGKPIQIIFTTIGAFAGTMCGVYFMGNIIGDEGDRDNILGWMIIGSFATYYISKIFTRDKNNQIKIALISLPLGGTFGFNTNDISDWGFPK